MILPPVSQISATIGLASFANCPSLKNIYYDGSASDYEDISIDPSNDSFDNVTVLYDQDFEELLVKED